MNWTIHAKAQARIEELAERTLAAAQPSGSMSSDLLGGSQADERVAYEIPLADIDVIEVGTADSDGVIQSLKFPVGEGAFELLDDGAIAYNDVVRAVCRQRRIHAAVGPQFVATTLREWLQVRLAGSVGQFAPLLLQKIEASVSPRKIVVPIRHLRIESPFDFGGVHFDSHFVTAAMLDKLSNEWTASQPDNAAKVARQIEQLRQTYQGVVCGIVEREAEGRWAKRGAIEAVESALSLLRLVSPAAIDPRIRSLVEREGRGFIPGDVAMEVVDGGFGPSLESVVGSLEFREWKLTDAWRADSTACLAVLERLLLLDELNPLQAAVLRAAQLLDESVRCDEVYKKPALALTAAESLLRENRSEPISFTLGLRCAYLTCLKPDDRATVDALIRRAYDLRSGYLHHGVAEADPETVSKLNAILLDVLRAVAHLSLNMQTRQDMFEYLRGLAWGAPQEH